MEEKEALTVVIEKLSEICNQRQQVEENVKTSSVGKQTEDGEESSGQVNMISLKDGGQTVYYCSDCDYSSHNKYYLRQHHDLVHDSKRPFKCPFCDYAGKRSYALKEHLIVHSVDRPHECVHCHATFRKKGHLSNHLKMHANQLMCSICKVTCRGKQQLLTHLHQQHSSPYEQVYACDLCFFASNDRAEMLKHLEQHTKQSVLLKCSECGFSCSSQSTMTTHMLDVHLKTSMASTVPTNLPKDSATKTVLDTSGRFTYNPENRTFACSICNYTCDQQRTIKSHIWKHSGHKDINYPMFRNLLVKNLATDNQETECNETELEPSTEVVVSQAANNTATEVSSIDFVDAGPNVVDTAKETTVIADVAAVQDDPSNVPINVGARKRRASDSILDTKRARVTETPQTVVIIQNQTSDQPDMIIAQPKRPASNSPTHDVANQKRGQRSGICSSLLAVIEQIRERTGTDGEDDAARRDQSRTDSDGDVTITQNDVNDMDSMENLGWDKNNLERLEDGHYRCRLCHYQSMQFLLIAQHMKLHKIKQPYECSLCDHVAENSLTLQEHMLQHCKVRTYQCKICNATFNYKSQLRAHCRIHENEPYSCSKCDFETILPMAFRDHFCKSRDEMKNEAMIATGAETNPDSRSNDVYIKHEPVTLRCKCGFSNTEREAMLKHQCTIAGQTENVDDIQCTQCDFKAISVRSLKSHMKRHVNDQRYVEQPLEQYRCTLCGYVCHHLPSLKSHMWRHASDATYSYSVANDVINAAINRDPTKNEAMETFITFRCIVCGFESSDRTKLSLHMKQHQDIIDKTLEV